MRFLYRFFVSLLLSSLKIARLFSKRVDQLLNGHQNEKIKLEALPLSKDDFTLWFHTASLGEFEQCRPLIEQCKRAIPKAKILLSFFSPSGYEIQKNYPLADGVCYLPFDTPKKVAFFLDRFQPQLAVLVKYEFWPNYLFELHQRKIPVFSVSSRFQKNQIFFKSYGQWMLKQLDYITHFFVQDLASKQLLEAHNFSNVTLSGDTRMDRVLEIKKNCIAIPEIESFLEGKPCVVIGSSWEADHALLFPILFEQKDLKIIVAPHLVDEKSIAALISHLKTPYARWTSWDPLKDYKKQVLIIDTIGLLSQLYQYAQWSYVGGGMQRKGLHNILEAAVFEHPVVVGKHTAAFTEAEDLIALGGVFRVEDSSTFEQVVKILNNQPLKLQEGGAINKKYIQEKSGATKQILDGILTTIEDVSP